ncbi:MAG: radical SAM protein [Candidatus Omnitrophota bacterium]
MQKFIPRLIVLELTRRCELTCRHCRANSSNFPYGDELASGDWLKVLDDISSFSRPIIILSGGEPLLRDDIFDIISFARQKELSPVLATCGTAITKEITFRLKKAGIKRISVSLDGKDALTHDTMRGVSGAFEKAVSAMVLLKEETIEFQVNTTVNRYNVNQLEDIFEMVKRYGALSFHPFFMVPVGRARSLRDMQISPQEYEEALNWLFEKSKEGALNCRPTCAPHYFRILSQFDFSPSDSGLDAKTQGCLAGKSFCFISSTGKVYPCGFLEVECGDARIENFRKLWQESGVFNRLRDLNQYRGKCGECEYLTVCGGCRARAYAAFGDYLDEEPECVYQPLTVKS